jgi:hypothetical protein
MAGYSATPLARKLGIKEGYKIGLVNPPNDFESQLGELPENARIVKARKGPFDIIVFFTDSEKRLRRDFPTLAPMIYPKGMLWIAWPKKSSKRTTDLMFANVQQIGLEAGLIDVKICAVEEESSGLNFVYR